MTGILIVEDELPIRELLTDLLLSEGYSVAEAATGQAALHAFECARPAAIVLDLMLPDIDGQTIARICWERSRGVPVPILLMSAAPHVRRVAEQLRPFGVRGFVSKPFDLDVFLATLEQLVTPPALQRFAAPTPQLAAVG